MGFFLGFGVFVLKEILNYVIAGLIKFWFVFVFYLT